MKKCLLILLCLSLSACTSTKKKVIYTFTPTTICANRNLKMVMSQGVIKDSSYDLTFTILKKVSGKMTLYLSDCSINGAMMTPHYKAQITKQTKSVVLHFKNLKRYNIKEVRQVNMLVDIEGNGKTYFNKKLTLYPLGTKKVIYAKIKNAYKKVCLLDSFQVSLYAYRYQQHKLYVALANKTNSDLSFSVANAKIDGKSIHQAWNCSVNAHAIVYTSIDIFKKASKKTAGSVTLPIKVYDYKNTSIVDHSYVINIKKLK